MSLNLIDQAAQRKRIADLLANPVGLAKELEQLRQQLTSRDAEIAELRERMKILKNALDWYGEEAKAVAKNMKSKNDMAVLASVNVLALDAGNRATLAATEPKA